MKKIKVKSKKNSSRAMALRALKKESERILIQRIRYLINAPISERMNFLRVKHPLGGSYG